MNDRFGIRLLLVAFLWWLTPAFAVEKSCEGEQCDSPATLAVKSANTDAAIETSDEVSHQDSIDADDSKDATTADTSEEKAPYVLRIISSGESKPRSENDTEEGLQDNRRVDVTVTRKVPASDVKQETRRALFGSGGAVWLSKDPTSLDRILQIKAPASVSVTDSEPDAPVEFDVLTNYTHFIDKLELHVWSITATQLSEPLAVYELNADAIQQTFEWDGILEQFGLEPGLVLQYSVKAYDGAGRFDESMRRKIKFIETDSVVTSAADSLEVSIDEDLSDTDGTIAELSRQSIPLNGSKVRIFGQDLKPNSTVRINGYEVNVESDGRFGLEYLLPAGKYDFDVVVLDDQDQELQKKLTVELGADYFFMVALADVTVGKNTVSGSLEPLAVDDQHFGGDIFVDGRLAFYLKGKVKGKYLITAQMDTGTANIEDLFDDFHRQDSSSVFRRLDPDQYYPVYGDDSTIVDDTDSQGKLYVRMDWDRSRAIWGNYNTNFNDTEYVPYNRSLYGAQLNHNSTHDTSLGDASHSLSVFASKAQSLFRRNEFLGTGGSLYYLRDTDIVVGSEKVWVEVRQEGTGRIIDRVPLVFGRDYAFDDFQGRIILQRPLLGIAGNGGPSIIRDEPLAGDQTFMVVEYEYIPQNLDFDDDSAGIRGKKWVTNNLGIGGTWVYEQRDGNDYNIRGTDITLKRSNETFIKGEFAQSESTQLSGGFVSSDGGLNFDEFTSSDADSEGNAFGIEARASLNDFIPDALPLDLAVWARRQDQGFSTPALDISVDTIDVGAEIVTQPTDAFTLYGRATRLERINENIESNLSAQIDYYFLDRFTASAEVRNTRDQNLAADTNGESTIAAAKLSVDVNSQLNLYGVQQFTVKESGTETENDATTVGAKYKANNDLSLFGELSSGDRGNSALLGTEVNLSDTYSVYSNYSYSFDNAEFEKNSLVLGQRKIVSSQLKVFSEHQFTDEDASTGFAHTIGLDQKLNQYTSASLSAQRAAVEDDDGSSTERNTVSLGFKYQKDLVQASSKFEYRWDEGFELDTRQWVTTNRFVYRTTPSFRWQGRLDASVTDDRLADDDARFIEAAIGFAYRPVTNDRLNLLGRITYLNDLPPVSQSVQTDERSLISSIEGLYDLTHTWSVGGKVAHRTSEIRLERNTGVWIDNDASLVGARVRYKANFGIDASVSHNWLFSSATEGTQQGTLLTIGRRVGDNLTFSVGYNFSSFDDNLANDSYDVQGWFINLIGTY